MTEQWQAYIPPRGDGEPDITDKQAAFIAQLITDLDTPLGDFDPYELGRSQASAFIEQLIELRDHGTNAAMEIAPDPPFWRRHPFLLVTGVALLLIFFFSG